MNENIERCQELAAEFASSRIDDSDEDWSFQWDKDYDFKFAELLLQECFKVMEETDSFYGAWMGNVLKKHFDIPDDEPKN